MKTTSHFIQLFFIILFSLHVHDSQAKETPFVLKLQTANNQILSEGSDIIQYFAINAMSEEYKKTLYGTIFCLRVYPLLRFPKKMAFETIHIYSGIDYILETYREVFFRTEQEEMIYDMRFLQCADDIPVLLPMDFSDQFFHTYPRPRIFLNMPLPIFLRRMGDIPYMISFKEYNHELQVKNEFSKTNH